ncbi:Pyridoxal-phosphate dependent enzyme [Trypanosoma melophagium]|uniref:Pyridoxal-phosphate dependent enzyme n=1 Tax=Trypanosoma melophagium TaxID=715481 RepID=UPI00351A1AFB|nr:Pyridoxal-phosphate dependent enzyme [Trypanosoma melophagium]
MSEKGFNRQNDVAPSMDALIGNTPAVYLRNMNKTPATIVLKLESENPMASVKDRLAYAIYDKAEKEGKIKPGKSVIVEATSGNTGIALALLGAVRGYKVIITMPDSMSMERRCLLRIFGAELILTPASLGMKGAVAMANRIVSNNPDAVLADQFSTKYNAQIHEETTGPEVWRQTKGRVDCFVAGVGTGGTLTGVARYLKSVGCNANIVAVEPQESPVLSGGRPGPHRIQGIGAGFVPEVLDRGLVDEIIQVSSDKAIETAQKLARMDGVFCGFSGGANVYAALKIAERPEMAGKTIVTVIPSFGERYLSTGLYSTVRDEVTSLTAVPVSEIPQL